MQSRKCPVIKIIFISLILCSAFPLFSQEKKFVQKIEWQKENNALEYKLEIKGVTNPSISKEITTEKTSVEFSMEPGEYKYRIYAYDFLGREASVTEWKSFSITKAMYPKVNLKDSSVTVDGNKKKPVTIPVDVESITNESTLTFVNTETGEKIEGKINSEKNKDGTVTSSSVVFPNVSVGEWKMVITNPSGLYTESEPMSVSPSGRKLIIEKAQDIKEPPIEENNVQDVSPVEVAVEGQTTEQPEVSDVIEDKNDEEVSPKEKKPYRIKDLCLTGGVISPYALGDEVFKPYDNAGFNLGIDVRLSWLPVNLNKFKLGFELNLEVFKFNYSNKYMDVNLPVGIGTFNIQGRYVFLDGKMGVNLKAGGGVSILQKDISYHNSSLSVPEKEYLGYICAQGGVSLNWIPYKHVIVETGVDFTDIFMPDVNALIIMPYVVVGVRF